MRKVPKLLNYRFRKQSKVEDKKHICENYDTQNLSDEDILSLFDEDFKDYTFDDQLELYMMQIAYKKGIKRNIKMINENNR